MLSSIVILIAPEALCDVTATIKQLTVMELTVSKETYIDKVFGLFRFSYTDMESCYSFPRF